MCCEVDDDGDDGESDEDNGDDEVDRCAASSSRITSARKKSRRSPAVATRTRIEGWYFVSHVGCRLYSK